MSPEEPHFNALEAAVLHVPIGAGIWWLIYLGVRALAGL